MTARVSVNDSDAGALWVWRGKHSKLRALWNEQEPVTKWKGVTIGKAGGADAGQGLTLVHFSAQLEPCRTQENTLYTLHTLHTA
jgi:hypothetical protein